MFCKIKQSDYVPYMHIYVAVVYKPLIDLNVEWYAYYGSKISIQCATHSFYSYNDGIQRDKCASHSNSIQAFSVRKSTYRSGKQFGWRWYAYNISNDTLIQWSLREFSQVRETERHSCVNLYALYLKPHAAKALNFVSESYFAC